MEQPAEPTFYRTQVGNAERLRAPIQKSHSPSSTYTCQDGLPTFSLPGPPWLEQLSKEAENNAACPAGFLVCYSRTYFPQPWASALASGPQISWNLGHLLRFFSVFFDPSLVPTPLVF